VIQALPPPDCASRRRSLRRLNRLLASARPPEEAALTSEVEQNRPAHRHWKMGRVEAIFAEMHYQSAPIDKSRQNSMTSDHYIHAKAGGAAKLLAKDVPDARSHAVYRQENDDA
jgi:hypothetical protein